MAGASPPAALEGLQCRALPLLGVSHTQQTQKTALNLYYGAGDGGRGLGKGQTDVAPEC